MRIWKLAVCVLAPAVALAAPRPAVAQVSATIHFGPPQRSWGHAIAVEPYTADAFGPWRTRYRRWRPVTLYVADGHYYPHYIRGARRVVVYRSGSRYFFPPRDEAWVHFDRRYNYRYRPLDEDYGPPPHH